MATLSMKKMRLIGLIEDKDKVVDALCATGCSEIIKTPEIEHTEARQPAAEIREPLVEKITRLSAVIAFVDEQTKDRLKTAKKNKEKEIKKPKGIFLGGKREVGVDDFYAVAGKEDEIFSSVVAPLEADAAKIKDLNAEVTALSAKVDALKIYKNVEVEASALKQSDFTVIALGAIKGQKKDVAAELGQAFPQAQFSKVGYTKAVKKGKEKGKEIETAILFACVPQEQAAILKALGAYGYTAASFNFKCSPKAKFDELFAAFKKAESERDAVIQRAFDANARLNEVKLLYDYLGGALQKLDVTSKMTFTKTVFVLDGWVPAVSEKTVSDTLHKTAPNIELEFSDPEGGDAIPTLQKHNKFVAPYSSITNMYSVPSTKEIDPNPFVAFFYMLFFGIMLADFGYGLILTVGCILVLKKLKPTGGGKKLVQVILMGGISTMVWGVLLGGYFGLSDIIIPGFGDVLPPILLSPMDDALAMLGMSIGIGLVQILVGMGISFVQKFKDGDKWDAILDVLPWHIFFLGLILLVVGMLFEIDLGSIPIIVMLAPVAVVLFTAGRKKPGIAGKITGGVGGLYKIIGFLSDLLSYSRFFGLALSGGVVALVFNLLGKLLMGSAIGIPFGIAVILVGHIFNIAINVLGTYVHDARLQYIEFFSRFYAGEGHLFTPLGAATKYSLITGTALEADIAGKK